MKSIVKCPQCRKKLTVLISTQTATVLYEFKLVEGKPEYVENGYELDDVEPEYECPYCRRYITTLEENAVAFLTGKSYQLDLVKKSEV